MSRIWDWEKAAMVGLKSSGISCTGKNTNKSSKRYSKRKL